MHRARYPILLATLALSAPWTVGSAFAQLPPSEAQAQAAIDRSPRHGEWVSIDCPVAAIKSWVMYPERSDKAPVIIVLHPGPELNDWTRAVADRLAADGYIAIAPELQRVAGNDRVRALDAVRDYARRIPAANGGVAAMGFGDGGTASLEYAIGQPELNAAIVFYGGVPSHVEQSERMRAPVLGLFAGADPDIADTIERVTAQMGRLGMRFEHEIYEGASAGFVSARDATSANETAAGKAWSRALDFLRKHLQ